MPPSKSRGKPATPARRDRFRRLAALVLAAALVVTVAGFAVGRGLGAPSIPSGAVAIVQDAPNGTITLDEYNRALDQSAARLGLKSVPAASSPQYAQVKTAAVSDLLLSRWVPGEAAERGITVSDTQVTDQLNQIIKSQFGGQKGFQQFLSQSHFTQQDALDKVRLSILSQDIQKQVIPTSTDPASLVSDADVKNFYDANKAQLFQQPETRDFRLILNKDESKVQAAAAALAKDDSPTNWAKVAKQYSTDPTTKGTGGLRQGVAKGQSEPALDSHVFSAPTSQLVGPFQGQNGFYLIEVEKVTPASTTPLDKQTSDQIRQQLASFKQQDIASSFQTDFTAKWTTRTFCNSTFTADAGTAAVRCENFTAPPTRAPGDAMVASTAPVQPGHATVFGPVQGVPQGPLQPATPTPAGLPPGVIGPGGAPLPPGAVPPGSVPPGAAPPATGAPPQAAPPQTAPPQGAPPTGG